MEVGPADGGAGPQAALVRFDDGAADRQAHTQTGRFGGEERVEDVVDERRRQARPGVAYRHLDLVVPDGDGANVELTAPLHLAHRIHRVAHEIEDHLLDLDAVGDQRREPRIGVYSNGDVVLPR